MEPTGPRKAQQPRESRHTCSTRGLRVGLSTIRDAPAPVGLLGSSSRGQGRAKTSPSMFPNVPRSAAYDCDAVLLPVRALTPERGFNSAHAAPAPHPWSVARIGRVGPDLQSAQVREAPLLRRALDPCPGCGRWTQDCFHQMAHRDSRVRDPHLRSVTSGMASCGRMSLIIINRTKYGSRSSVRIRGTGWAPRCASEGKRTLAMPSHPTSPTSRPRHPVDDP